MRRMLTGAVDGPPGRHGLHRAAWGPMIHLDLLGAHPAQACPKSAIHAIVLAKRIFVYYITGVSLLRCWGRRQARGVEKGTMTTSRRPCVGRQ